MYANKNRYTTADGIYKENYYYHCKNNTQQLRVKCDYKRRINKYEIEPYVIQFIKQLLNNNEFIDEVSSKISNSNDSEELLKDKIAYENQLNLVLDNKVRLEANIDNLPLNTSYREERLKDMNNRLIEQYDVIYKLKGKINDLDVKVKSKVLEKVTKDMVFDAIKNFDTLFDCLTDEEKKDILSSLIKNIHVNETPNSKGSFLKNIKLNFSIGKNEEIDINVNAEDFEVSQEDLNNYIENTFLVKQIENFDPSTRKNYYVRKNPKTKKVKLQSKKITYKMIQSYILEKYGFKTHTAYIAEVKRSFEIDMYDAPNAVETLKNPRKHPTKKHIDAITDALIHFKVIAAQ